MAGEIYQAATPEDFVRQAAELIATAGAAAVAARGRLVVALTGGQTVQPLYRRLALADGQLRHLLAKRADYFWGDERLVPHDHPASNFGLARRLFLDALAVVPKHLHPVTTGAVAPADAARAYEQELRNYFGGELTQEGLPLFDLVLLGLGPDGHVASLFPGSAALAEQQHWVARVSPLELAPRVARVTLTLPVLNQARLVLILVAGAERIKLARLICAGEPGTADLPAARLRPAGRLVWLLAGAG